MSATGAEIVRTRDLRGCGFTSVDEMFVEVDVPLAAWDRVRDRAVTLPG